MDPAKSAPPKRLIPFPVQARGGARLGALAKRDEKPRKTFWIVGAIVVAHGVVFWFIGHMRALPDARYVPPRNFSYHEERYTDPATGESTVYREYRVSTKLAGPKRPAPGGASTPSAK